MLVSLKLDAKFVIEDAQVAVFIAHDRFRHNGLNFLRDHADVSSVAAVIAEAVEADTVRELPE